MENDNRSDNDNITINIPKRAAWGCGLLGGITGVALIGLLIFLLIAVMTILTIIVQIASGFVGGLMLY